LISSSKKSTSAGFPFAEDSSHPAGIFLIPSVEPPSLSAFRVVDCFLFGHVAQRADNTNDHKDNTKDNTKDVSSEEWNIHNLTSAY